MNILVKRFLSRLKCKIAFKCCFLRIAGVHIETHPMVPNIFEIEVYVMHLALAWCREHKARGVQHTSAGGMH